MANPTLTPFPPPPLPEQDEVTFNRNAANSLLAQANFVNEGNIVITWMGQQVTDVASYKKAAADSATAAGQAVTDAQAQVKLASDQAVAAKGSADNAKGYRDSAQTYAAAAQSAAGAPTLTNALWVLRIKADKSGVEWGPGAGIYRSTKTAAFTVQASDISGFFDCTGSFTVTLASPASLGAGFFVYIRNFGSGLIKVSSPESGFNVTLYAGESYLFLSDGSSVTYVKTSHSKVFESTQQTLATDSFQTIPHGLGALPKSASVYLLCTADWNGYVAGDKVELSSSPYFAPASANANPTWRGVQISSDATNIYIKQSGLPYLLFKNSGATNGNYGVATSSNFALIVKASM